MSDRVLIRLSGSAFVLLLLASGALFGELLGAFGDPDSVFEDHYASAANRRGDIAGAYVLAFTGIAFLVFSSRLQADLTSGTSEAMLSRLASASAIVFSALLIVSAAALSAVSFSISFGEAFGDDRPFNSGYALMPQLGAVLLVIVAPLVAASYIVAFSLAAREHLSSLVMAVSLFCALVLLFSVLYLPLLALPVWVLVMAFKAPARAESG
jgi:hypothetical protein